MMKTPGDKGKKLARLQKKEERLVYKGSKAVDEGREKKADRLLGRAANVQSRKIKVAETMKKGGSTKSKVNEAGNYTNPGMRKSLFNKIKAGTKGGDPGEWSARKAQLLASEYKKRGGGYKN
jgi:hypothetical protein